ncbi:UDP-N-acetylglucosamine 2-epimerase [Candidatus Pelagibacter sp.]|nr:UDP-N-acetylglucosamine 2-epimerase [Candidatus Pelagibacter sp.]
MKKIFTVTSSRSEFGILKNIILELSNSKKLISKLIVTGTHLEPKFGKTINEINNLKIKNISKIKIKMGKTSSSRSSIIAFNLIKKFNNFFIKDKPDAIILFGDRFEILPIANVCFLHKIPIIHIGGGETTEGSSDESIRHAVSKLSSFHFVTHKIHKNRLIQLGEDKKKIFIIGSPGIENIKNTNILSRDILEKRFNFTFFKKNFVVNFYPITNKKNKDKSYILELLNALERFKDVRIIFTLPAFDIGTDIIITEIKKFVKNNKNSIFFKSLGSVNYLSILHYSDLIIGNSSSGLIEAPSLGTKVINIGERQKGRIRPKQVIDIDCKKMTIEKAIANTLKSKIVFKNIYPNIKSSKKFVKILSELNTKNSLTKKFIDLKLFNEK